MTTIPPEGLLQGIQNFGLRSNGSLPFAIYPNSENIPPPVKKEKLRVVEPSTRADVNMQSIRDFHEKKEYWANIIQDERLRKYLDEQDRLNMPRNNNIDVSV